VNKDEELPHKEGKWSKKWDKFKTRQKLKELAMIVQL